MGSYRETLVLDYAQSVRSARFFDPPWQDLPQIWPRIGTVCFVILLFHLVIVLCFDMSLHRLDVFLYIQARDYLMHLLS